MNRVVDKPYEVLRLFGWNQHAAWALLTENFDSNQFPVAAGRILLPEIDPEFKKVV